jgi:hypothetical protein
MSCYSGPAVRRRTGEPAPAADAPPAARAPRCMRLANNTNGLKIRSTDQCPNEQLPGSELCAHHLAEAVREWNEILAAHALGEATP